MSSHLEKILILDFGSQYTQLIARRIRECGVYCEIVPFDYSPEDIRSFSPKGIVLSGGPASVTSDDAYQIEPLVFELGVPVLGICYGMQVMAHHFGGRVEHADKHEYGAAMVRLQGEHALFSAIDDHDNAQGAPQIDVWMSHGDHVADLPADFELIGSSDNAPIAAMAHKSQPFMGLQFHPEVTHTRQGMRMLGHFVHELCGCGNLWTPSNIVSEAINDIRDRVGNDEVILGLSGGVDSSVVAALCHQAIGEQLHCVFVDNGLLREGEVEQVKQTFVNHFKMDVIIVDARARFYAALEGVDDPEQKRKIIGNLFIEVFEEQAERLPQVKWLAQGTIYPDVIESAHAKSGKAQVIKSHHNVGGLPERMSLQLLEPLRECFKDEVRKIGLECGLPHDMVYRHPFPGPGLAVRILGEVKQSYADILRQADAIYLEELYRADYYHKISQAFAVFLPVKSVGVVGDARCYDYVISLRAVETVDFMTAHITSLPYELLTTIANRIMNEVAGVSRVVYDVSSKPPATIEWE
jgi:GMP synthase (glutamine-hydrolysing)